MFKVLAIIVVGFCIGTLIRSERAPKRVSKVLNITIYILLLSFGIGVGANSDVMDNLDTIGLKALIITIGGVVGSCICASIIERRYFKNRADEE